MWLINEHDIKKYEEFVEKALTDDSLFDNFKVNPDYCNIVGMSDISQYETFCEFNKKYHLLGNTLNLISKNDIYGGLPLYNYQNEKLSLNTLRYLKTTIDIFEHLCIYRNEPSLHGQIISEIGIGYSGLAYVFNCIFHSNIYALIDIPSVQQFALRYLNKLKSIKDCTNYTTEFPRQCLLTISEFCLSELDLDTVRYYNDNILRTSKYIYLMTNIHEEDRRNKFLNIIKEYHNIDIYPEYPKTQWPNKLVVGQNKFI